MTKKMENEMGFIDFAIVHHANQYLITNGYQNREGLDDLIGIHGGDTGYLKVFQLHAAYEIPFNLHLSGTLLEAILWHHPDFLSHLKDLKRRGLLDLIGSSYGQNIMRFFGDQHNFRQLNEELNLYANHLGVNPPDVKVFWPPERVWDTKRLAPLLTDIKLLNRGYQYILTDDRLFHPSDETASRHAFDQSQEVSLSDFYPCGISKGSGLIALPISFFLRQNIPPHDGDGLKRIEGFFRWLASQNPHGECSLIAIYGDDLEKSAGCCGWAERGTRGYELFLKWLVENPCVRPVKLNEWAGHCDICEKPIEVGTYYEMSHYFGAGEDYTKWYHDPNWDKYRNYFDWSENKVSEVHSRGADPALLEMAWKHLLASSWETAWHTPTYGAHGNPSSGAEVSPWAKAIASHSRHAVIIAEASYWMKHKEKTARAYLQDIDSDGDDELILKNERLFAVFSPRWGGRLIYLFELSGAEGKMVIGNSCDDWNWMEELNSYMEIPANHPGALVDEKHENDRFEVNAIENDGNGMKALLVNQEEKSEVFGLSKTLRISPNHCEIEVTYRVPQDINNLCVGCGFSPDYLSLLRFGSHHLKPFRLLATRGYSSEGVSVWVRLGDLKKTIFDEAEPRKFGHGYLIQIEGRQSPFTIWIGTSERPYEERKPI